jgi:WD40 repeat protein
MRGPLARRPIAATRLRWRTCSGAPLSPRVRTNLLTTRAWPCVEGVWPWTISRLPCIGTADQSLSPFNSACSRDGDPDDSLVLMCPAVFISCSADKTVRVWDVRNKAGPMITTQAHDLDVNVCSWSRCEGRSWDDEPLSDGRGFGAHGMIGVLPAWRSLERARSCRGSARHDDVLCGHGRSVTYLLATGSDDGSFKVWDLRHIQKGQPIAHFTWHKGASTIMRLVG